jgi:hypothetical protein
MARKLWVGMMLAMLVFNTGSRVAASPVPIYRGADVKFTLGGTSRESTVVAEGLGVRVSKRIGPDTVKIRVEVEKDAVEISANAKGLVRVARRGQSVEINMASRDQKALAKARRMMEGSAALTSFDALIDALAGDQRAVAKSMLTTWTLINAARGADDKVAIAARRMTSSSQRFAPIASTFTREETPIVCWAEYSMSVATYYAEYAQCVNDYGWIPGMVAVCTFEWLVKAELAWFWVLGCSGGMPV